MQKFIVAVLGAWLSTFFGFAGTAFINTHPQARISAKVSQHTSSRLSVGTKMAVNTQSTLSLSPTPSTTFLVHQSSEEQEGFAITPTPDIQSTTEQQQSQSVSPTPEPEQNNQGAEEQVTPTVSQQANTDTSVDTSISPKDVISNVSGLVQNVSVSVGL